MKRIITFILAISLGSSLLLSAQDKDKHNYDVGIGINAYGVLGAVGGQAETSVLDFSLNTDTITPTGLTSVRRHFSNTAKAVLHLQVRKVLHGVSLTTRSA